MLEKCSTAQSFIRTEMTSYRIGTLLIYMISISNPGSNVMKWGVAPKVTISWRRESRKLISKQLFGILEFFQKTNERIRHSTVRQKNPEFVRSFFGRIVGLKKKHYDCLSFKRSYCAALETKRLFSLVNSSIENYFWSKLFVYIFFLSQNWKIRQWQIRSNIWNNNIQISGWMMWQIQKMDFFWSGKRVLETDVLTTLFQLSHKKPRMYRTLYLASFLNTNPA